MSKLLLNDLTNLQNETTAVNTINDNNAAIVAALDQAVYRNGDSPNQMNADFDMNSNRILNLPAPIYPNDVIRLQDVTSTVSTAIADGSITNAKLAPAPAYTLKGNNTNGSTTPTDLTVNLVQSMLNEGMILAGVKTGVNMNSTADQAITITMPDHYTVYKIFATNPSTSMTTAVGGIYTGAGKTGIQVVANSQVYSGLTTSTMNTSGNLVALNINSTVRLNLSTLYFSLTTPQGAPSTMDLYVFAFPFYSANLNPSNPNTYPVRQRLSGTTNFYVTTTGNDSADGSLATPWRTLQNAYNKIQANYDLSGFQAIVNVADGTYGGITGNGPIVGQIGATGLIFKGNTTSPANVVIAEPLSYAFGAAYGAAFSITGFKIDMTNGQQDMITVGQEGEIWVVNLSPGTIRNVLIFGTSAGIGFNDMSAAFGGKIFIDSWVKYTIDSTGDAISTTGTWSSGSGTISVPDASNIKVGMAVRGTNIYRGTYVASKVGNVLTLNGAGTFGNGSATPITLTMSRQNHADVGVQGQIIHNTNGTPGYNAIELLGNPHYNAGFILSNGSGAQASFQTIAFTGTCTGLKFVAKTLGSIDTLANMNDPATYLPGDSVTKTATFAADTADFTISSNGSIPYTGTEVYAGALVVAPQFRGPQNPSFGTATSEMTTVDMVKGTYSLGTNNDLRVTRKSIAAGSAVNLTFVGLVGQGGQYN